MKGGVHKLFLLEDSIRRRTSSLLYFGVLSKVILLLSILFLRPVHCSEYQVSTISGYRVGSRLAFQSGIAEAASFSRRSRRASKSLEFPTLQAFYKNQKRTFIYQHPLIGRSIAQTSSSSLFLARGRSQKNKKSNFSSTTPVSMPRGVKKENLPSKICVTCGRPFTWRKKWEKVWDEVTTCSKSCNHKRRLAKRSCGEGASKDPADDEQDDDNDMRRTPNEKLNKALDYQENANTQLAEAPEKSIDFEKGDYDNLLEELSAMDLLTSGDDRGEFESEESNIFEHEMDLVAREKAERKAAKKAMKAERRAQREGRGDPTAGQKECDMCSKSVDLLIRCMHEGSQTDWSMVCGKCWKLASGGVVDGDKNHPHYRYGGLWKNRRAQKC